MICAMPARIDRLALFNSKIVSSVTFYAIKLSFSKSKSQLITQSILQSTPRESLSLQDEIQNLLKSLKSTIGEGIKRGTVKKREALAQKKIQYALQMKLEKENCVDK